MGEIIGRAAAGGGKRGIKGVSKAKSKAEFDGAVQSSHKGAGRRLDGLQTRGLLMIGSMRLIRIVY